MRLILIAFLFPFSVYGQNLVPNPSFEEFSTCDLVSNGIFSVDHWYGVVGYADYYNACSTNPNFGVPQNAHGYQLTSDTTGDAYIGLALWFLYHSNTRQFVGVELMDTLVRGGVYSVKFEVSMTDSFHYAINSFGVLLSKAQPPMLDLNYLFSQVSETVNMYNDSIPIDLKDNWKPLSGSFIADGGERFLTLGNFNMDSNTIAQFVPNGGAEVPNSIYAWKEADYYLDNVSVILDSVINVGINEEGLNLSFTVYPNPIKDILNLQYKPQPDQNSQLHVEMFSLLGEQVLSKPLVQSNTTLDVSSLPAGVYLLHVNSNGERLYSEKVVITE